MNMACHHHHHNLSYFRIKMNALLLYPFFLYKERISLFITQHILHYVIDIPY